MLRYRFVFVALLAGLFFGAVVPAHAQNGLADLSISTAYPSLEVGIGETVSLNMDVKTSSAQIVDLGVSNLPEGWQAEFHGGGRVVQSVYVTPDAPAKVELRVTPSAAVKAGTYQFTVTAQGGSEKSEFPVEFIVKDKVPAQVSLATEFPTVRGGSDTTFSYSVTLKNDGDEDITVGLSADAPKELSVTFKSAGKDITNLPTDIKAGSSQIISVDAAPLTTLAVGTYPFTITAQGDNVTASLPLTAEVVGQPQLSITTPDGRLSDSAYLGRDNPIKLILKNAGNSPAEGVKLSATAPSGWTVTLDPAEVLEVPANDQVEVTADIKPSDNAIAGDYDLTFRAQPTDSVSKSADFRITVKTSTIWGFVGIVLIAVALAIVGMAVSRFGRR